MTARNEIEKVDVSVETEDVIVTPSEELLETSKDEVPADDFVPAADVIETPKTTTTTVSEKVPRAMTTAELKKQEPKVATPKVTKEKEEKKVTIKFKIDIAFYTRKYSKNDVDTFTEKQVSQLMKDWYEVV